MFKPDKKHPGVRTPRDPAATIKRIMAAAREEFGAHGFDGAKIEHIARRAGVSKQLIYIYYSGKEDLYNELLKSIQLKFFDELLKLDFAEMEPAHAIRVYLEKVFDQFTEDPVSATVHLDQSLHAGAQIRSWPETRAQHARFQERLDEVLERGRRSGQFDANVRPDTLEIMTTVIVTGCLTSRQVFNRYLAKPPAADESPAAWREFAISFILRALRP